MFEWCFMVRNCVQISLEGEDNAQSLQNIMQRHTNRYEERLRIHEILKSQYGDGNMGTVAEQQMFLKIDKVHTPWPMSH